MPTVSLGDVPTLELAPGVRARIVESSSMTVAHVYLDAGTTVAEHSHVHEQIVNVIEGDLELTVENLPNRLTAGNVYVLRSGIRHSARAITDCYVIDVFHPVREDFRPGFKGYTAK